jgi:hypothetical protein
MASATKSMVRVDKMGGIRSMEIKMRKSGMNYQERREVLNSKSC